jgi:Restriction endonuclease
MSDKVKDTVKKLISKIINIQDKNMFDCLMQEFENYIEDGVAHNICEIKEKANNKKKKGDLFEAFCFLYIENVLKHDEVWFYKDFPIELKNKFDLTKNDYGIDLLSKRGENYYAIQCKYRKPQEKIQTIPWKSLSTFYAIVVKTGPWLKHITMTNTNGCRHIGKKTDKDWSICLGTFRKIGHFSWLKIIDSPQENSIVSPAEKEEDKKELLRQKRLAYYSGGGVGL